MSNKLIKAADRVQQTLKTIKIAQLNTKNNVPATPEELSKYPNGTMVIMNETAEGIKPIKPITEKDPEWNDPKANKWKLNNPYWEKEGSQHGVASVRSNSLMKAANRAEQALTKLAKKDKGHTGFVFPKTHPKVTDNKDHFPIGNEGHGRAALQEMGKYTAAPKWYSGSLEGLKSAISRAVHAKYPGIKSEKKKK